MRRIIRWFKVGLEDERGMGLVEVAIIIIIIIAMALIFQQEITELLATIFNRIDLKVGTI